MNARRSSLSSGMALGALLAAAVAAVVGCSNDNSGPSNTPPDITDSGSGGKHPSSGGKSSADGGPDASPGAGGTSGTVDSGSAGTDGGSTPETGGKGNNGGSGGQGAGGASTCDPSKTGSHPKGCFPCSPTKDAEYLNHCTESDCQPFDNAARLGASWNGGKLIPLQ